jgi:hypothetical protein
MTASRLAKLGAWVAAAVVFASGALATDAAEGPDQHLTASIAAACQFVLGFGTLDELLSPPLVGSCLEDEHHNPSNGDGLQQTSGGLLVWRKADNWTAFTDGAETWINGPFGLAYRLNEQRFTWEPDAAAFPAPPAVGVHCGTERWAVKTLSDARAAAVDPTPRSATVDALRGLPQPRVGLNTPRVTGVETTTYEIQVDLVRMSLEADEDIHLVVAEPGNASHTLIVEFAAPSCQGVTESTARAQIAAARSGFAQVCGMPSRAAFAPLSGSARLTGVGFFDVFHGQNGVAPNGIELHPVMRVDQLSCGRG